MLLLIIITLIVTVPVSKSEKNYSRPSFKPIDLGLYIYIYKNVNAYNVLYVHKLQ